MTASLDLETPDDVVELLEDVGVNATLKTIARTVNNSAGTVSEVTTQTAVIVSPPLPVDVKYVDGDTVKSTDSSCWLAGKDLAVEPTPGARLVVASTEYLMQRVRVLRSGNLVAAYNIFLRAA